MQKVINKSFHKLEILFQSLSLAVFVNLNCIAAAISIKNGFIYALALAYLFAIFGHKFILSKLSKKVYVVLFLSFFCFLSAFLGESVSINMDAIKYGGFCIGLGLFVFSGDFIINILYFLRFVVLIGLLCSPSLLEKSIYLIENLYTVYGNSGTMMGETYAIVIGLLGALSLILIDKSRIWQILSILLIVMNSQTIMKIGSRGVFIVLAIFIIFLLCYTKFHTNRSKFLLLFFSAITTGYIVSNLSEILESFNTIAEKFGVEIYALDKAISKLEIEDFSSGRINVWENAFNGFLESPLGHWVGSFEARYNLHQHNFILELMWNFGVIGLFVGLVIIIKSIKLLLKGDIPRNSFLLYLCVFCSSIVILFYSSSCWMLPCFYLWIKILVSFKTSTINKPYTLNTLTI